MGAQASTMNSLQILKVSEHSVSHRNRILPFVHTVVGFNGRAVQSKDDALAMNREWDIAPLRLELADMRTSERFVLEVPKKSDVRLGISVKFHQKIVPLLSMQILGIDPDSPAECAGMLVGDCILGVENMSSEDEDDLLRYVEMKRGSNITLLAYNRDLEYIRAIDVQVGTDVLLGCQVGMGEVYTVPYNPDCRMEFDAEVIDRDIKILRERGAAGVFVDCIPVGIAPVADASGWEAQEQTLHYPELHSSSTVTLTPLKDALDVPQLAGYGVDVGDAVVIHESEGDQLRSILEERSEDDFSIENSLSLISTRSSLTDAYEVSVSDPGLPAERAQMKQISLGIKELLSENRDGCEEFAIVRRPGEEIVLANTGTPVDGMKKIEEHPHSEGEASESADIGSPPFSDPGSIL